MLLLRYVSQPSVFLAGLADLLLPKMSMLSKRTDVELATSVYHCGLYRKLRSWIRPPCSPMTPNRIGRRM